MIRTISGLALALLSTVVARSALAQTGAPTQAYGFGGAGQLAISSDFQASLMHHTNGGSITQLTLRPAADYFVIPNVSVGGQVAITHVSSGGFSDTAFGLLARAGYHLAFGDIWSFWPKGGLGFDLGTNKRTYLDIYAPVLVHPIQHFFLGFGPALQLDLTNDAERQTGIGLTSVVGGWLPI